MNIRPILLTALGTTFSLWCQAPPDFTPRTPLIAAALANDTAEVKRLLAAGADPNEAKFLEAPVLFLGLINNNAVMVRALLEKGADPKGTDRAGSTMLMWAAANDNGDPEIVNELLKRGVDPNAKNLKGETALAWAMRRGNTPVVEALQKAGASDGEMIKDAVSKAVALLQKSGPEFIRVSGCVSCHHQSLPHMAFAVARERGIHVDAKNAEHQVKAAIAMLKPFREGLAQGKPGFPDPAISLTYIMLGLHAEGYPRDEYTDAMANMVSTQQTADGSFMVFPARPPMESSVFTGTALSLRALQVYGNNAEERIARARKWLEAAKPKTTEDRVMQLLGMAWANSKQELRERAGKALLAEQGKDGGWSQLPGLESDAYATGQALVSLHLSGQLAVNHAAYQRAVTYLLRTQMPDGSWLVRSRAVPFQVLKESGFPHGKHQWISASGTSWAAMSLGLRLTKVQQISQVQ